MYEPEPFLETNDFEFSNPRLLLVIRVDVIMEIGRSLNSFRQMHV